ncbi:MAG: hypothetical protein F6J86_01995 [Symploca sp. SIO1B1]|nr:hypothetical protein [Symploca sp. SIO1B1]
MLNTTKASGKMTLTFNQTAYCSLLTEVAPQVIEIYEEIILTIFAGILRK